MLFMPMPRARLALLVALGLMVGGLRSKHRGRRGLHVDWISRELRVGDGVEISVIDRAAPDRPRTSRPDSSVPRRCPSPGG